MRSGGVSRPIEMSGSSRILGRTLELAREYLTLTRDVLKLVKKRLFLFKKWRRKRLDERALEKQAKASELWGELYLRYRPLISVSMVRGGVKYGSKGERSEAVNRLVRYLERIVEANPSKKCFAELLWEALGKVVGSGGGDISNLHERFHILAVLDEFEDVQGVIKMGYYYRGETTATGATAAPLSDLELDEMNAACAKLSLFMVQMGLELDRITCDVLRYEQLRSGDPSETVRRWLS